MADLPRVNLTVRAGNEKSWLVTAKDEAGAVVSLLGVTSLSVKAANGADAPALFTKTIGDGVTLTDAVNGVFRLTLVETDTATLGGYYYYEAQAVDALGVTQTILRGTLHIEPTLH